MEQWSSDDQGRENDEPVKRPRRAPPRATQPAAAPPVIASAPAEPSHETAQALVAKLEEQVLHHRRLLDKGRKCFFGEVTHQLHKAAREGPEWKQKQFILIVG